MALASKQSQPFYVTTGGGTDEINAARKTTLTNAFTSDKGKGNVQLIDDNTLGPIVFNVQRMQDDIDELRRFVADASELRTVVSPLPVANGGTGLTASQPLVYLNISIDASEMASLNSTRKTCVAAPGANNVVVPVSIMIMCDKLNGSTQNTTLVNLYGGYYDGSDNRSVTRTPAHSVGGLLYNARSAGSYHVLPISNTLHKESNIANKEYALLLDAAPGANGATASKVLFIYYIADVS